MSLRGSNVSTPYKEMQGTTYENSYITNQGSSRHMASNLEHSQATPYSVLHQQSTYNPISGSSSNYNGFGANTHSHYKTITPNEVSQLTGSRVGSDSSTTIKGQSRIQYVPYEKKVVDYETRTYKEVVPKTRRVTEYEEKKIIETIPREVVKQDYYAVEKITQYYKEFIPEKKIEMVPVEKKIKRLEYVPIERQIVHYPSENGSTTVHSHQNYQQQPEFRDIRGKSRVALESQGVTVFPDAEYKPISSDLLYKYTNNVHNQDKPIGYVDMGERRNLSTAPGQNGLGGSRVTQVSSSYFPTQQQSTFYLPPQTGELVQHKNNLYEPIPFHSSQVYAPPTVINRLDEHQTQRNYQEVSSPRNVSSGGYNYR